MPDHKTKLYNILLILSRNIFFYEKIELQDSFETRIYLMFMHFFNSCGFLEPIQFPTVLSAVCANASKILDEIEKMIIKISRVASSLTPSITAFVKI